MSYKVISEEQSHPIKAWIEGVSFDDHSRAQVRNIAKLPFIHKHIALMPDVHVGIGATIGSVIPTTGAIIPAAVGVDLGCGMMAVQTTLRAGDLPSNLHPLREAIERAVPHGGPGERGSWPGAPDRVAAV